MEQSFQYVDTVNVYDGQEIDVLDAYVLNEAQTEYTLPLDENEIKVQIECKFNGALYRI